MSRPNNLCKLLLIALLAAILQPASTESQSYVDVTPNAADVTASANDGNVPGNAVDGDLNTRWSANGDGQWLQLEM
jgi:poly(beta-D-mannuronate) lyase